MKSKHSIILFEIEMLRENLKSFKKNNNISQILLRVHVDDAASKDHVVLALGTPLNAAQLKGISVRFCTLHKQEHVTMYCRDCRTTLCSLCNTTDEHKKHKLRAIHVTLVRLFL